MESTAEVWAAVCLVLASAASLSFRCILTALTPYTQLFTTALLILSTGLKEQKQWFNFSLKHISANSQRFSRHLSSNVNYFCSTGILKVTEMREHGTHLQFDKAETQSIDDIKSADVVLVKYKWDQRVNWSLIAVRQVPTLTYCLWIVNVGMRRTVFWFFPCREFFSAAFLTRHRSCPLSIY